MNGGRSTFQRLLSADLPQEAQEEAELHSRGRRLRVSGIVWVLVGSALVAYILVVAVESGFFFTLGFGLGAAAFYKGIFNLRLSRQHFAPNAEQLLQRDPRPPVLYLRPFDADDIDPIPPEPLAYYTGEGTLEETLGAPEEEQLALAMNELGPFIAIGKPYDILPKLGAARVRVSDEQWKAKVTEWVSRAQLIVLRVGFTKGVEWEVAHIVENAPPEKLVLLLPFTPATGYDTFRERMREHFNQDLPEIKRRKWTPPLSVCGLLYFSSGWEPHFVRLKRPLLNRISRILDEMSRGFAMGIRILTIGPRSLATLVILALQPRNWVTAQYKRAFRPVIQQLGLRWKRPAFTHLLKPIVIATLLLSFLCVKFVQEKRDDEIQALETQGEQLNDTGQYGQAIRAFTTVIQMSPKGGPWDLSAFLGRATAYEQESNYAAAIQDYSAAITIDPEDYSALDERCWLRAVSGQLNDALSDCDRALALKLDDLHLLAHTHENRALVYLKLNKFDASIADYRAALHIDPMLPNSQFGLGVAEVRNGDRIFGFPQMDQGLEIDADVGARFAKWGVRVPK